MKVKEFVQEDDTLYYDYGSEDGAYPEQFIKRVASNQADLAIVYSPCGQHLERKLTRHLALSMFECLEQLHRIGGVHRDLSPHNFVTFNGRVVLIDFGTIRFLDEAINSNSFSSYEGSIEFAAKDILEHILNFSKP